MNFINKLERKIGRYAIKNLMRYIIILYVIGYILMRFAPDVYNLLVFDPSLIMQGQVWRIVTFLVSCPVNTNIFFVIITLYFYYVLGSNLEQTWGAFRFNFYFFFGVILNIVVFLVAYLITGIPWSISTYFLNMSLFFAFAATYPNAEVLMFFIIPIKMKWLALIDAGYFVYIIISTFASYRMFPYPINVIPGAFTTLEIVTALANFFIFFLLTRKAKRIDPREIYRKHKYKKSYNEGARTFSANVGHKCAICGRTSVDHPELTFRFCSKCNGNYEYCNDHLFSHQHVK